MSTATTPRAAALRAATADLDHILPPRPLLQACRALAADPRLRHEVVGRSEAGHPIERFQFGHGRHSVLLYGFPDPGEAIGGTGCLALMRALLAGDPYLTGFDVRWTFFPCLNFDDQPADGEALIEVMRDPTRRELDWCLDDPRPETQALLDHAAATRPLFTYPLHDEYHSGEVIPAYLGVTPQPLPPAVCDAMRTALADAGFAMEPSLQHPAMGQGFLDPAQHFPQDFPKSTFSILATYGTVLHCELSQAPGRRAVDLVRAQLEVGLIALEHLVGTVAP